MKKLNRPQRVDFTNENREFDAASFIHALECYLMQVERNLEIEKGKSRRLGE